MGKLWMMFLYNLKRYQSGETLGVTLFLLIHISTLRETFL